jgi:hypothetical protein
VGGTVIRSQTCGLRGRPKTSGDAGRRSWQRDPRALIRVDWFSPCAASEIAKQSRNSLVEDLSGSLEIVPLGKGDHQSKASFDLIRSRRKDAAMRLRNLGSDMEAKSEAVLAGANLASEKRVKEPLHRFGRDRFAGVGDPDLQYPVARESADLDGRPRVAMGQGVGQEIGNKLSNPPRVKVDRVGDIEFARDRSARLTRFQFLDHLPKDGF